MHSNSKARNSGWRVQAREKRSILFLGDLFMAFLALGLALYLWSLRDVWALTFWRERVAWWYYFIPFVWLLLLLNLYDPHRVSNLRVTIRGVIGAAVISGVIYAVVYLLVEGNQARIGVGFFILLASLLTLFWRLIYIQIFTSDALQRRVLILGCGKAGETILEAYHSLAPRPFHLVGFIDDNPQKTGKQLGGVSILTTSQQLAEVVEREMVSDLVIAIGGEMKGRTFQAVLDVQEKGVEISPMALLYEELLGRVPVHHLESEWLIRSFVIDARPGVFYEFFKRILDVIGSLVGLAIFVIIFPFIALGTILDSGLPIVYWQIRSGRGGRNYNVVKFRTMRQDAEKDGAQFTIEKDERITRLGNFLRRTHLDEVPQFWNVLRGEMSLVGPRAERPEWVAQFEKQIPFYRARLMVKPGVTGWAQVNYAYSVTVEEMAVKLEYDLYYIKHRNLLMDISIILRTIWQVLGLRGR
jgi:exopolysaccharide biosynthesis polyprenyl glycosylphosphotransferase